MLGTSSPPDHCRVTACCAACAWKRLATAVHVAAAAGVMLACCALKRFATAGMTDGMTDGMTAAGAAGAVGGAVVGWKRFATAGIIKPAMPR